MDRLISFPRKLIAGQLLVLLSMGLYVGCYQAQEPLPKPTSAAGRSWYRELPGFSKTTHLPLQEEFARLRTEGGLPSQLVAARGERETHPWHEIFPDFSRRKLAAQIERLSPTPELTWGPVEQQLVREQLPVLLPLREKWRTQLSSANNLGTEIDAGILIPQTALEAVTLGAKLEVIYAAAQLAEDHPSAAFTAAGNLLHAARLLSREGPLNCRLAAIPLRQSALRIFTAICNHPAAAVETRQNTLQLLRAETDSWPREQDAWRFERAQRLIAYELIRAGHFLAFLSEDELQALQGEQRLKVTAKTVRQGINEDQLRYLHAMQRLISLADRPFIEQQGELQALRSEIDKLRDAPQFPLVAGNLFLADFEQIQRQLAEDLSAVQTLVVLLQHAVGDSETPVISPFTGQPMMIEETATHWQVKGPFAGLPLQLQKPPSVAKQPQSGLPR